MIKLRLRVLSVLCRAIQLISETDCSENPTLRDSLRIKVLTKSEMMMSEGIRNDINSRHSLILFCSKSNYGNN